MQQMKITLIVFTNGNKSQSPSQQTIVLFILCLLTYPFPHTTKQQPMTLKTLGYKYEAIVAKGENALYV